MVIKKNRTAEAERLSMALGTRVAELRYERNWSQRDLAERAARIDRAYVSRIETGQTECGLGTIGAIARAFGLSISELFERVE